MSRPTNYLIKTNWLILFQLWLNILHLNFLNETTKYYFQYDRAGVKDRQGEKNPSKRAKAIITKLDISGDKKLSREEFIKGYIF